MKILSVSIALLATTSIIGTASVTRDLLPSPYLVNWTYENMVLKQQPDGLMGPGRVGERPKVLKSPTTGEYVMIMHSDNMRYKDPCTVYATSTIINGEYTFQGPLLYKGNPIKKWDVGTFVDNDGKSICSYTMATFIDLHMTSTHLTHYR
ncbi:MAG: hypothetical protein NC221_05190 [Duncaniella sp.]|nr:hypothetical protein [Muribaculum sp.]MCM1255491.1 hypothetical protein [Duncaniella sp.]